MRNSIVAWFKKSGGAALCVAAVVALVVTIVGGFGTAIYLNFTSNDDKVYTVNVVEYADFGDTEPATVVLRDTDGDEYEEELDLNDYTETSSTWAEARSWSKDIAADFKKAVGTCVNYTQRGKLWKSRIVAVKPC